MPFNLTEHDSALVSSITLLVDLQGGASPIDGFPDGASGNAASNSGDRALRDAANVLSQLSPGASQPLRDAASIVGGRVITFQFPARLKSDSKDARWQLIADVPTYEPSYLFQGGGPRRVQLYAEYVVGGPGGWSTKKVANEIRRLKSYFYIGGPEHDFLPVFKMTLYEHAPNVGERSAWRGKSIEISPSEELIRDNEGIYPLISRVTLSLEQATRLGTLNGEQKYPFTNIPRITKKEWY